MPFKKGHNIGRPKGSKSEKTQQWEELGLMHENGGAETAKKILEAYGNQAINEDGTPNKEFAEKYLTHYGNLLEYFKPKMSRVTNEHTGNIGISSIRFEDAEDSKN